MRRFAAWFRHEWLEHRGLILGSAVGTWLIAWLAVLLARTESTHRIRIDVEAVHVLVLALAGTLLAGSLFGSERRHGAASLPLRMPGARVPAFCARLALLAVALVSMSVALAFVGGLLCHAYDVYDTAPAPFVGSTDAIEPVPVEAWLVFPRWVMAEMLLVGAVSVAFALLASAWTKRTALAVAIGIGVPLALAVPLFLLTASRPDFFDLRLPGAAAFAARPLVGLALLALAVSWFVGRRALNRPWRAVGLGLLCLLVGGGVGYAWTARAFAAFDRVEPTQAGFRLAVVPRQGLSWMGPGQPAPQLSASGRYLYLYALRHDRGIWPWVERRPYGPWAKDFRDARGTAPRLWRFGLDTGEATQVGDGWDSLHARTDASPGLLTGWGQSAGRSYGPHAYAMLGPHSRLFDLESGRIVSAPFRDLRGTERDRSRALVLASRTAVRTVDDRPAWLQWDGSRSFVVTATGRDEVQLGYTRGQLQEIPGGWSLQSALHVTTVDATDGRLRTVSAPQWGPPPAKRTVVNGGIGLSLPAIALSPRHVLGGLGPTPDPMWWRWRILDMDSGELGPVFEGPAAGRMLVPPLPDGRLLCVHVEDAAGSLALWEPQARRFESVSAPSELGRSAMTNPLQLRGGDNRGNRILTLYKRAGVLLEEQLYYFHRRENTLTRLAQPGPYRLAVVGIDAEDRVIGLEADDHTGFRRIVRLTPGTGEREVVFPR